MNAKQMREWDIKTLLPAPSMDQHTEKFCGTFRQAVVRAADLREQFVRPVSISVAGEPFVWWQISADGDVTIAK